MRCVTTSQLASSNNGSACPLGTKTIVKKYLNSFYQFEYALTSKKQETKGQYLEFV